MKKTILKSAIFTVAGTLMIAAPSFATPVDFSGATGSATVVNDIWFGAADLTADFVLDGAVAGLPGAGFTLDDGESMELDFVTFGLTGWGLGTFDLSVDSAFVEPAGLAGTVTGGGWFGTLGGVLSGGQLSWDVSDFTFDTTEGNTIAISLEDALVIGWGSTYTSSITFTNLGGAIPSGGGPLDPDHLTDPTNGGDMQPVPEPATMLLFGTGLAGMASMRRKKKNN